MRIQHLLILPLALCAIAGTTKENKAKAQSLIAAGKTAEAGENYDAARLKYTEAQGADYKAGTTELNRLQTSLRTKAKTAIEKANAQHAAKDHAAALQSLLAAEKLTPGTPGVVCNLAVVYKAMSKPELALPALDACIDVTAKSEERMRLEQLRTQWTTGESVSGLSEVQKQKIGALNKEISDNARRVHPDKEEGSAQPLCARLIADKDTLPKTPSVLFNLARCFETAGRLEEAARSMEQYLAATPEAGKDTLTGSTLADLKEILSQQGEQAEKAKSAYARAMQYIGGGKLDKALVEYETVAREMPALPRAQWKVALFQEAMGDLEKARASFIAYQALADESGKKAAQEHLNLLDQRKQRYEAAMVEVRKRLDGTQNTPPEKDEELMRLLNQAVEEFPLAGEANQVLGYLHLQHDHAAAARTAFDSLALHGRAPFFYASVGEQGKKGMYLARVQLEQGGVRILPVSEWDKKKKAEIPLACKDKAAHKRMNESVTDCGSLLESASIKSVEVKGFAIFVMSGAKSYTIYPANATPPMTVSGPVWRKYNNRYARLFTRYAGHDGTKLGKEGFTGREKFGKVMEVASIAAGGAAAFTSMGSMISASSMLMTAGFATTAAIQVLQSSRNELRGMIRAESWKAIPVSPMPLAFRLDGI